jgi:geranylgeranyl pyrophosphate synthase
MVAQTLNFEQYVNSIRQEIIESRFKAFKAPSMVPHADVFSDIMDYHSQSTGKLLRPTLCVLVSDALGGEHSEAVHIGAAIELVHAGSLVHDDLIDNDLFRRGMKTIHEQFSVKSSVLFGDILFVASASSVRTLPDNHMASAFKELMDAYGRTSSGAMRENNRNPWDRQEYLDVIKLKTASLYRASARLGCIVANATSDTIEIISKWAEQIGIAFQLEDDIADIRKSIERDEPIGDVKEGKATFPIMYLREKYPTLKKFCDNYIDGVEHMDQIVGLVAMMPEGINNTELQINKILQDANTYLDLIPFKHNYDKLLKEYGTYLIDSMKKET